MFEVMSARERAYWIAAAVAFALLAALAPRVNMYYQNLLILAAMNVAVAAAWALLAETGQISLGHAGLFAAGAYTSGLLYEWFKVPLPLGVLAGTLPGALLGGFLGYLCRRMPRWGLALVSLAMAELMRVLLNNLRSLTRGAEGVMVPPLFHGNRTAILWAALAIAAAAVLTLYLVRRTRVRYTFAAILGDEAAAAAAGINVAAYKVYAFALSGLLTGLVGAFYTPYVTFIDPPSVAGVQISIEAQIMAILGGLHTVAGPVLGAVVLTGLSEFLRSRLTDAHLLVYGVLLIAVMMLLPRGLVGVAGGIGRRLAAPPPEEPAEPLGAQAPVHSADGG